MSCSVAPSVCFGRGRWKNRRRRYRWARSRRCSARISGASLLRSGPLWQTLDELGKALVQSTFVRFAEVFDVDELVAGAMDRDDQLVQFQLNGECFLVLCPLNEEDHQEGDDGRARIDDE